MDSLRSYDQDGVRIMEVSGEFDLANCHELEAFLSATLVDVKPVVIDFSAANYIDSSVLSVLARQKIRVGERLRIVVPDQTQVRRIFAVTGLDERLNICGSIAEAQRSGSQVAG